MTIRWDRRGYTKEEFTEAWLSSKSLSEVARKLGSNINGGGYYTLRRGAQDLGLDESHMPDKLTRSSAEVRLRQPLSAIMVENSTYQNTDRLRRRLISEKIKEEKCEICLITEWQGARLPLALDHINGDRTDNRLENLQILCYNCHGQTPTFGKKIRVQFKY